LCFCYYYENSLGANNSSGHSGAQDLPHTKKHTLQRHRHIHTQTSMYIIQIQQSEKIRARKKEEEHCRISSKSRISHEFVSCTISLISPLPPHTPTNHHPKLPSAIDKNVTVRFYPWPHHPRGYYPPSRTTPFYRSSPRSSLYLFSLTLFQPSVVLNLFYDFIDSTSSLCVVLHHTPPFLH